MRRKACSAKPHKGVVGKAFRNGEIDFIVSLIDIIFSFRTIAKDPGTSLQNQDTIPAHPLKQFY